jgi:hypothetical protein
VTPKKQRNGIISYNINSDMIIIDGIMSEIELEISEGRVKCPASISGI